MDCCRLHRPLMEFKYTIHIFFLSQSLISLSTMSSRAIFCNTSPLPIVMRPSGAAPDAIEVLYMKQPDEN